jgi:DNA-binding winged helix-turn-helix (wHTH) protein
MAEVTESSSFRIDLVNLCLWRKNATGADKRLDLPPKTFDVLRYLVENAGRLVTHDELLTTLWHDVHVQPEVLKTHILGIRNALGDKSASPHFIETHRGRGYRFIGEMNGFASPGPPPDAIVELGVFAGRAGSLQQLLDLLRRATSGEPQAVFISGEPGIGKTALVQQFLTQARSRPDLSKVSRGLNLTIPYSRRSATCAGAPAALGESAPSWN